MYIYTKRDFDLDLKKQANAIANNLVENLPIRWCWFQYSIYVPDQIPGQLMKASSDVKCKRICVASFKTEWPKIPIAHVIARRTELACALGDSTHPCISHWADHLNKNHITPKYLIPRSRLSHMLAYTHRTYTYIPYMQLRRYPFRAGRLSHLMLYTTWPEGNRIDASVHPACLHIRPVAA